MRKLVSTRPPEGENVAVVAHQWHYLTLTGKGIDGAYRELGRITLRDLERLQ